MNAFLTPQCYDLTDAATSRIFKRSKKSQELEAGRLTLRGPQDTLQQS
ncbi:hypothetical protein SH668x_001301 [Planctomicrobium sp. SH668]